MAITMDRPALDEMADVISALGAWQSDEVSVQLHPGDLGWHWRFGADAVVAATWTWSRDGEVLAVGMLDSPGLVRLSIAPSAGDDEELARQLLADLSVATVEARFGPALHDLLTSEGWAPDEPWTPLRRDLTDPVEPCGARVEVVDREQVPARVAVQRAAFDTSTFTEDAWQAMAAGPAYAEARCLLAYDDQEAAVATATVWSAGTGRPGLLEPVGVHRDHRGRGHGRAITLAAAAHLREMGASSAIVCTPSANVGAVRTYESAGLLRLPEVRDLRRPQL